jgi:hypothetical protein
MDSFVSILMSRQGIAREFEQSYLNPDSKWNGSQIMFLQPILKQMTVRMSDF